MSSSQVCEYFLVENVQKPSIIPVSCLIFSLSTLVNLVGFYVILRKSKKETTLFRCVLFGNQFFLWLSQGFWALFMNTTSFFPFPALSSASFSSEIASTHELFYIWLVLLSLFAVFMCALLVVRHRMIVRTESFFHCPEWFYVGGLTGGWAVGLALLMAVWTVCDSSEEEKANYVRQTFPSCLKVLRVPGVLVITQLNSLYALLGIMALVGIAAEAIYIIASCIALFELSKHAKKASTSTLRHHRKVLIDTMVQILIKTLFLSTWTFWLVTSYFIRPEIDTRNVSTLVNSLFVAAPIPGTIAILVQNTGYRTFLLEKCGFRKRSDVAPSRLAPLRYRTS